MVFESLVAELLNRHLGDYVENLDHKHLKLGLWREKIVLRNLVLKTSALEELNLPTKIAFGSLGKLVLKIPWKNLYNSPVEATVQSLFLVMIPSQETTYDADKEEKWIQNAKQRVLFKVEEAKKKALEENEEQTIKRDSFVEKLMTQILKNLKIVVQDIHIRYEDKITNEGHPFALGITLHNLSIRTTNDKWEETMVTDVDQFHKIIDLDGLSIYWNCDTKLYWSENITDTDILSLCKKGISTKSQKPTGLNYILGPINSVARLIIRPKPGLLNYQNPKFYIKWDVEKLSLGISKSQYRNLLALLEHLDRMSSGRPYRKYRPVVPSYRGYYRQWWRFAITCVLVAEVRHHWTWSTMLQHRVRCREYAVAYRAKLSAKKVTEQLQRRIEEYEKQLDALNIVLVRQTVETKMAKLRQAPSTVKKKRRLFVALRQWFRGTEKDAFVTSDIAKKFESVMTAEERAKLYEAIGYNENASVPEYPEEFVELRVTFLLAVLHVEVRDSDDVSSPRVLCSELRSVTGMLERRPTVQGIMVQAKVARFAVSGMQQGRHIPALVVSKERTESNAFLNVLFETHPLDKTCDQRIHISSMPLEIIYDAGTINKLVDIFTPPQRTYALIKLQTAATSRLEYFKRMSMRGWQHAIHNRSVLDLNVDLKSSYFILPKRGIFMGAEDLLIVNLGRISVKSVIHPPASSRSQLCSPHDEDDMVQAVIAQSYDNFVVQVQDMQVLMAVDGENWKTALMDGELSPTHLLTPTSLKVNLDQCVVLDAPWLPNLKVTGHLPSVAITLSDDRLLHLVFLFTSIPYYAANSTGQNLEHHDVQEAASHYSMVASRSQYDMPTDLMKGADSTPWHRFKGSPPSPSFIPASFITQAIEVDIRFHLAHLSVTVCRNMRLLLPGARTGTGVGMGATEVFGFRLTHLELSIMKQTFELRMVLRLRGVSVDVSDGSTVVRILDTPSTTRDKKYLFTVDFNQVDCDSPEFLTIHHSIEQYVDITFTTLKISLHQEALLSLLEFGAKLRTQLNTAVNQSDSPHVAGIKRHNTLELLTEYGREMHSSKHYMRATCGSSVVESDRIVFRFTGQLQDLTLTLATRRGPLLNIRITGCSTDIKFKTKQTNILARVQDICMQDMDPKTLHSRIVSIMGGDHMLNAEVILHHRKATLPSDPLPEVSVQADVSCIRVVYVGTFVTPVLHFFDTFQVARDKVLSAAADAASTAKQNLHNVQMLRLKLVIKLQAPLFVFPINATSMDAIEVDFGRLTIENNLHNVTVDFTGDAVMIDDITIGLHGLTIMRVKITSETTPREECPLLQPISFQLNVSHNLSAAKYACVPQLRVEGKLHTVKISLSEEDLKTFIRVLRENVGLGFGTMFKSPKPGKSAVTSNDADARSRRVAQHEVCVATTSVSATQSMHKDLNPEAIQFSFVMDYLSIELYNAGIPVDDVESLSEECNTRTGLVQCSVRMLSITGTMQADSSISTLVTLGDCLIQDARSSKLAKLITLMQKKDDNPNYIRNSNSYLDLALPQQIDSTFKNMLEISYHRNCNEFSVDIYVFSFELVLSLEFMMCLAGFFTSILNSDKNANPIAENASRSTIKCKQSHGMFDVCKLKNQSRLKSESRKDVCCLWNVQLERPDILLVENMDDIDTNCIVFNSELQMCVRLAGRKQMICLNGSVTDLQLSSCVYNPDLRHKTKMLILHPCRLDVITSSPDTEGLLCVAVTVSPIQLVMSPTIISQLHTVCKAVCQSLDKIALNKAQGVQKPEQDFSEIWKQKSFTDDDYWFLKPEDPHSDCVIEAVTPRARTEVRLSAPMLLVTLEAGLGKHTSPTVTMELNLEAVAHHNTSRLDIASTLGVKMYYYNSRLGQWELIVEPTERYTNTRREEHPWEIQVTVALTHEDASDVDKPTMTSPSRLKVNISSRENLELTVTKTFLHVLATLTHAFQSAVGTSHHPDQLAHPAPYVVHNHTGAPIVAHLKESPFQVCDKYRQAARDASSDTIALLPGSVMLLDLSDQYKASRPATTADEQWNSQARVQEKFLPIELNGCKFELPMSLANTSYFSFPQQAETCGLVSEVTVSGGGAVINLRSIIQVHNHLQNRVEVHCARGPSEDVHLIGSVEADSEFCLPLDAIHPQPGELYFTVAGYKVSARPFKWRQLKVQSIMMETFKCKHKRKRARGSACYNVVGVIQPVTSSRHLEVNHIYCLHLRPTVVIRNLLPIDLTVGNAEQSTTPLQVVTGASLPLINAEPKATNLLFEIPAYLGYTWSSPPLLCTPSDMTTCHMSCYYTTHCRRYQAHLSLGVQPELNEGTAILSIYSPFWMVNKTGIAISYRTNDSSSILHHPGNFIGPLLLSLKNKTSGENRKVSIKIADGNWSESFSIDVAGTSGVLTCQSSTMLYKVGVQVTSTASALTKKVTFTPFYIIANNSSMDMDVQEPGKKSQVSWKRVAAKSYSPLWPESSDCVKFLRLRIADTTYTSADFCYTTSHSTLLKLSNRYGGVHVQARVSEMSCQVTCTAYKHGAAPAVILNHTEHPLLLWERGVERRRRFLRPYQSALFTWRHLTGQRSIIWKVAKHKEISNDLAKDAVGEFTSEQGERVYWVSFLDGVQRTLLFTRDARVVQVARSAEELERVETEVVCSFNGLGLSLVNNDLRAEILYFGIASSAVWEGLSVHKKRHKPLAVSDTALIETAYRRHEAASIQEQMQNKGRYVLDNNIEVDFTTEELLKPEHLHLRRIFNWGIWVHIKMSSSQLQLHGKIHRLQIDNQLYNSMFPVMLAPVESPKTIATCNQTLPFAELSIVRCGSPARHYKYLQLLVQEFHVKLDLGLLNALAALCAGCEDRRTTSAERAERFRADVRRAQEPLAAHVALVCAEEQKHFFDYLQLSPLKIHLSFSVASDSSGQLPGQEAPPLLTALLQSLGVVLVDVQDVVFKLACFESESSLMSMSELMSQVVYHYKCQALKQLYVLVLGLDVLGNPYGLVAGITRGVGDLFYEPFQGAIQGPGEFVRGLVLGVRSLVGHTVGGAAGAASRITGAAGKGAAALTFDKDYQRQRRESLNARPVNLQSGLAQSGKQMVMGVLDGVAGVFTRPFAGAQLDGVAGFCTGVGKGMVGLVARPATGVIDFASESLEAVKRVTARTEEMTRLRMPRFLHPDGLIRPYSAAHAEGNRLLREVQHGSFYSTDTYSFHVDLTDARQDVLLLTNQRVMYLTGDMFGKSLSWSFAWSDIQAPPRIQGDGVYVRPNASRTSVLRLFQSGDGGKLIPVASMEQKVLIADKIVQHSNNWSNGHP